jgi:toxin ParE1/3/4
MKLFFTPLAACDLDGILDFIAANRPLTAQAVVARLKAKCKLIASQPELGQRRQEFPGDYRSFPAERWVIFYRIVEDTVQIHRVLDGSRDFDSLIG